MRWWNLRRACGGVVYVLVIAYAILFGCMTPTTPPTNNGNNGGSDRPAPNNNSASPNTNANTGNNVNANANAGGNANDNGSANGNTNSNTSTNGNDNGDVTIVAPQIGTIDDFVIPEGVPFRSDALPLEAGTAPITWSLDRGPAGLTIESETGVLVWDDPVLGLSPLVEATAEGPGGSDSAAFLVTVEMFRPPTQQLISMGMSASPADGASSDASTSDDGRYVAFASDGANLVPNDENEEGDIFVYDRGRQQMTRVSVTATGAEVREPSGFPRISGDGTVVVFRSFSDEFAEDDDNRTADIFAVDLETNNVALVSRNTRGQVGDGASNAPAVSADGRFVAFSSTAANLVDDDRLGHEDVFVRDRTNGTTTRVSVSGAGDEANGPSIEPAISADGRYVAFRSAASNLVNDDDNDVADIFVHDRLTADTFRISVTDRGTQADGASDSPAFGGSRFVVFVSRATNLASADGDPGSDVYRHDLQTSQTVLVSRKAEGGAAINNARRPHVSADGARVVFQTASADVIATDANQSQDIFVYMVTRGETRLVSMTPESVPANDASTVPWISADGRIVVFESKGSDLVSDDTNDRTDIFVHDLETE